MAASTYAACLTERATFARPLTVFNAGGLVGACADADGMVRLSGNATYEWAGSVDVDVARERAGGLTVARHYENEMTAWASVAEQAREAGG